MANLETNSDVCKSDLRMREITAKAGRTLCTVYVRTFDSCLTSTWLKVCSFQQSLCTSNIIHEIKKKKEGIENHFGLLAHRGSRTVLLLAYIFTVHGLLETDGVKTC